MMLLCDVCDAGWHMDCLPVPLQSVPEGMPVYAYVCVCVLGVCVLDGCVCVCVCVCARIYTRICIYTCIKRDPHLYQKRPTLESTETRIRTSVKSALCQCQKSPELSIDTYTSVTLAVVQTV